MLEEVKFLSFQKLCCPAMFTGLDILQRIRGSHRMKLGKGTSMTVQVAPLSASTEEDRSLAELKKVSSSSASVSAALTRSKVDKSLLREENTVGIIGGLSAFSTLVFLEKLVWWGSRNQKECIPFVVCSDPTIKRELLMNTDLMSKETSGTEFNSEVIVDNLKSKRKFLELSGAQCIVMPCHVSHVWHRQVSEGCSVTFLNVGDCVARELKDAKLKPLEAGSDVKIGVLARDGTMVADFYQKKLQNEGFEVVLPDKPTMEHIIIPATEALIKKDYEGARNLLRVAIQILLVRAVNTIIIASDEFQDLLPHNDPLLKKCIDPMDALARSTVQWAQSIGKGSQHID